MDYINLSPKRLTTMGDIDQVTVDMRVTRLLRARRDEILDAIGGRTVEPTLDLLRELAELDDALGIDPLEYPEVIDIATLRAELIAESKIKAPIQFLSYRELNDTDLTQLLAGDDETGRLMVGLTVAGNFED